MSRMIATGILVILTMVPQASADTSELVVDGAKVEKLADGFIFTEGPAVDAEGNVFFTDIPNSRIHRWSTDGKLSTFRENTGRANGLFFDRDGNLLCCEGGARQLTSVTPDGKVNVLANDYDGKKLNSPNDLWIDPQGGIYFSDPRYGDMSDLEQDGFHVYYLSPDRKKLMRVVDDMVKPNGVLGTKDGKLLYVADAGDGKTYVYKILGSGQLGERKLIAPVGSDGMTLDEHGNLYLTRGAVRIYSPSGESIGTIEVPEGPANVVFGGKDRKTLFITARKGFYAIPMKVRGQ